MDTAATADARDSTDAGGDEQAQPAASPGRKSTVDADDSNENNKFQKAVAVWKNIDLTQLIPSLDSAAAEIVASQRDSIVQRKDLAQKTKDFRRLDDAEKLGEFKALLKAYQTFIDLITNQSKTTQSTFLQLYSSLSEAPDPYPLLEASIDALVVSEEVVPKITAENQQLHKTFSRLTSQLDETEKRLDAERVARRSLEESREAKAKEIEESWSAVLHEKQTNWGAKERGLEEKVENQDRLLKELKASYEVSQRLAHGELADGQDVGIGGASAAEFEMISADLERTSLRLAQVEARNEQLRLELAQLASQRQAQGPGTAVEDDPAFLRLRSENSSLLRKVDAARLEKDFEMAALESKLRRLERELATLKADRDNLWQKVQKWSDYDDLRRELDILKTIELATGDDLDEEGEGQSSNIGLDSQQNGLTEKNSLESLEKMLLARNKKLNDELTSLRVSHRELQGRLEMLQDDLSSTNMELEKSRNLTTTLENDLLKMQDEAANALPSSAMSVAGTYTTRHPSSSYPGRRGRASPTSSIISGFEPQYDTPASLAGGPSLSILPMVTAQRDRFKKRNAELEAELAKTYQTVSSLRSEIASLQKDNLTLYEKTRYVATYNRSPASSASAYQSYSTPSTIATSPEDTNSSLDRYRSTYESNISPFYAFRGRESARALKRMSLPERVLYQITRRVLATRTSRNLFATYCFFLHLLIFIMVLRTTSHDAVTGAGALAKGLASDRDLWQQADLNANGR